MYDNELTLISYTTTKDSIGCEIKEASEKKILCKVSSIGSAEFYQAQTNDLKPEMKFIIHSFEYAGEKVVEFNNVKYQVIRTFMGDTVDRGQNAVKNDEIELTCEKVIGNVS